MPSFGGDIGVNVEERCLDEELISIPRQCDDFFDILLIVGEIDHVSDLLPARCAQGLRSPSDMARLSRPSSIK
jgi:hypothetical protein